MAKNKTAAIKKMRFKFILFSLGKSSGRLFFLNECMTGPEATALPSRFLLVFFHQETKL